MSNRLFQGVIHQMRDAIDRTVGVIDETGSIISCSELERIGGQIPLDTSDIFSTNDAVCLDGVTYLTFGSHLRHEYAVLLTVKTTLPKNTQEFSLFHFQV